MHFRTLVHIWRNGLQQWRARDCSVCAGRALQRWTRGRPLGLFQSPRLAARHTRLRRYQLQYSNWHRLQQVQRCLPAWLYLHDVCQTRSYIELLVELFGGSIAFSCRHFCFDKTTLKCRRCESADLFTFASTGRIVIPTNAQNTSTIDVPFNVSPQRHRVCNVMHTICCHVFHHSRVSLYVAITSFSIQLPGRTIREERCHDTK